MSEKTENIELNYTITFSSIFHCGTGLPGRLLDRTVQRDSNGYLFIPGSTIKGTLRDYCGKMADIFNLKNRSPHDEIEAMEEYNNPDILSRLFGSRAHPGSLYFDDALMNKKSKEFFDSASIEKKYIRMMTTERTQVGISRYTGTSNQGYLFSSEFGLPELIFEGTISGFITDEAADFGKDTYTYSLLLLIMGLKFIDRIGGNKSAGAGHCTIDIISLTVDGVKYEEKDMGTFLSNIGSLEYADMAWED